MPKLPKFEDWQAPWEKNETEFNADIAKKLIYDKTRDVEALKEATDARLAELTTKNNELQSTLDEQARKNLTAEERLAAEKKDLETKLAQSGEAELQLARLRVALREGLTEDQAKRLIGSTEEELAADAKVLLESFGGAGKAGDDEAGEANARRTPVRRVNPGGAGGDDIVDISTEEALKLVPRI